MALEVKTTKNLEDCFKTVIQGDPLDLQLEDLNYILRKMGKVLKGKLKEIVPYMLAHYIQNWPGWQKINSFRCGKISYEDWLRSFEQYIIYKVNYLIQHGYEQAKRMLDHDVDVVITKEEKGTITARDKVTAPFELVVEGAPALLNTLVFCKSKQDDITLKTHSLIAWETLSLRELLNWSHIEVRVFNRDISFIRKTNHSFKRYLALMKDTIHLEKSPTLIESVQIIDKEKPRKCVSIETIKQYFTQLLEKLKDTPQRTETDRIKVVVQEIILDMLQINYRNSFATNTCVNFRIGETSYARNKKVKSDDVCFSELLIPKVELSFIHFMPNKQQITEADLNELFENLKAPTLPLDLYLGVEFRCTYCKTSYMCHKTLVSHLYCQHNMDLNLKCCKCNLEYTVKKLASNRWKHRCEKDAEPIVIVE